MQPSVAPQDQPRCREGDGCREPEDQDDPQCLGSRCQGHQPQPPTPADPIEIVNHDCLGSSDLDCGRVPGKLEDAAVMEPAVTTTPLVEVTTVRK